MITIVRDYIQKQKLLQKGDRVTVALSGGADSVCLLLCMQKLQEEYALSLQAVHVHHGLRGEEADRDAAFCRDLCARLRIPFVLRKAPVKAYAEEHRISHEEAGRILRYQILRQEAAGGKIAVAHHREDQAETLLFHMLRGTGIRGLAGMAPLHEDILRPFLCVSRGQIEEYLAECGQDYQIDSTNGEDSYTRNQIRHHLLPVMEELRPRAVDHLCSLAEQAAEVDAYLDDVAGEWLQRYGERTADRIRLPFPEFGRLDGVIGKRVLFLALEELCRSRKDIGSAHICRLWELREDPVGKRVSLPGGWEAVRGYRELCLQKAGAREPAALPEMSMTVFPAEKCQKIPEKQYTKWFDYDKIKDNVQFRFRQEGDYLTLAGVGRKTVKAYMIDRKIPAGERSRIPLVADGSHVLWIVGYRISEAYKVTDQTKHILQITIGGKEDGGQDSCVDSGGEGKCQNLRDRGADQ